MDYDAFLEKAMKIFNEKMGTDYSADNIVLRCLTTEDQMEVFQSFCTDYFPDRLKDRYEDEGYFAFRASSFIGWDDGSKDGILLRTDIPYKPAELIHVFLHELAHIFCCHNELNGKSFYNEYCEGYAPTTGEDEAINAGYAVWRECIAEIIAIECDDNCAILSLRRKKKLFAQLSDEIEPLEGKLAVSQILVAVMTSLEVETAEDWASASESIRQFIPLDLPEYMALFEAVYRQLRGKVIPIDIDFISEIGALYMNILAVTMLRRFQTNLQ